METGNWSLLFFTMLSQASAGIIIMGTATLIAVNGNLRNTTGEKAIPLTAMILLACGLALSFFHLGYPSNFLNALNNLATSWMSREILITVLLFLSLITWYTGRIIGKLRVAAITGNILSVVLSAALVYIMIKLYSIPAINTTGSWGISVSFITTTLFSGSAIAWIITRKIKRYNNRGLIIFATIILASSMANSLLFNNKPDVTGALNYLVPLLYMTAILLSVPLFFGKLKNKWDTCSVIIITLGFIVEIFNRYIFLNFTISGL